MWIKRVFWSEVEPDRWEAATIQLGWPLVLRRLKQGAWVSQMTFLGHEIERYGETPQEAVENLSKALTELEEGCATTRLFLPR